MFSDGEPAFFGLLIVFVILVLLGILHNSGQLGPML